MTITEAIEAAKRRLLVFVSENYGYSQCAQDVNLLIMDLNAARDHAATLAPRFERMIDRYNEQSKLVERLDAQVRALSTIAALRALKRAA